MKRTGVALRYDIPSVPQNDTETLYTVHNTRSSLDQFAQELLSTFSTSLGEVSLVPATGGVFSVDIIYASAAHPNQKVANGNHPTTHTVRLWDRKAEGGFPGTSSEGFDSPI